ncbi:MAG: sulfatase [Planctomycetes bacterium]|nr:sulfatase [Planctomycetota bacterium]
MTKGTEANAPGALPDADVAEDPARRAMRLELHGADDALAWPEPRVFRRFDVVREVERWKVEAPAYGVGHHPGVPETPATRALLAGAARPAPVQLSRAGTYEPQRFDSVRLALSFSGSGSVRVLLRRAGALVTASELLEVPVRDRPTEVVLPLPRPDDVRPCDELVVDVSGTYRTLALSEVEFLVHPLGSGVPDPDEGTALVSFGGEARRGVGLLAGRPLWARGRVPTDGRLSFSWAVAHEVDASTEAAAEAPSDPEAYLDVLVDEDGEPGRRLTTMLGEAGEGWERASFDVSEFAGREVALSFVLRGPRQLSLVVGEAWLVSASAGHQPTVLLVTSDTHRGDHVGVLGQVDVRTPALDALAARGVLFDDAWSTVNNTTPSHAALFTGLSPRDTGVLDNFTRLASEADTLAEEFARGGFATWAAVSSGHLGPADSGLEQGFERVSWTPDAARPAAETVEDALEWLPEAEGRPLFLWVHVFDAHIPYEPPPDVLARLWDPARDPRAGTLPDGIPATALPPSLRDITDLEYPKAEYRAEIEAQDAVLARLFAAPRLAAGVLALVADHGECLGEDGILFRHEGVLPATLHVPLVLAGPGVPVGVRSPARVQHTDLGRTLLDLAGLDDAPFPGRDLLEQLDPERVRAPRFALEAFGRSASVELDGMLCVLHLFARDTSYVLVKHAAHEVQLFDVRADPSCEHDLLETHFEQARRLRALLIDWLDAADPSQLADHGLVLDDAQRASLESLGYVQFDDESSGTFFVPDDCAWCRRFER